MKQFFYFHKLKVKIDILLFVITGNCSKNTDIILL